MMSVEGPARGVKGRYARLDLEPRNRDSFVAHPGAGSRSPQRPPWDGTTPPDAQGPAEVGARREDSMADPDYLAILRRPELLADLRRILEPAGCHVGEVSYAKFEEVAGLQAQLSHRLPQRDCGELIVQVEHPEQFDRVMETAFGDRRSAVLAQFLSMFRLGDYTRAPFPRLLVPKAEPGEPDIRTWLGTEYPVPYMRWNLDEVSDAGPLANFSLYEPDATLIRQLVRGSDLLRLEQALVRSTASTDCERLAELAEAAIMAARHSPGPPEPVCAAAIARICELRDDSLERAVLLAVGHALAVAYEPRWWSTVERIGLDRLCAEVGLKRDRCGEREVELWSRLRRALTRVHRWYDLPGNQADAEGGLGGPPRPLPTTREILRRAVSDARGWFKRPFGELRAWQVMPEAFGDDRPFLRARKVRGGWEVQYLEPGQPPRHVLLREKEGRLSRILLPMLTKMAGDIESDVAVGECGWVPVSQLDPDAGAKLGAKFRKDKSDLRAALKPVNLGVETAKPRRMRLAAWLAEKRTRIEILPG